MFPLAYLDQNVFSNMLKPEVTKFDDIFSKIGLSVAFSWVHLFEMRHNSGDFGALLDQLGAEFILPPDPESPTSGKRTEKGNAVQRLAEFTANGGAVEAFEAMLASLHHTMGGQREKTPQEIAVEIQTKIDLLALQPLRREIADEPMITAIFEPKLHEMDASLVAATDTIGTRQPEEGWALMDQKWASARHGDPMRNMDPLQKVDFLLGLLPAREREAFDDSFPRNFAKNGRFEAGKVSGLAMGLFGLGLTERKKIFSGARQERNFRAQVMDTLHIEAASACETFFTFDKGATDLARATFAYAGIPTVVLHMTSI